MTIYGESGGSEGAPIVFLHGLGATAAVWRPMIDILAERRWVAFDLPGHGGSARLTDYNSASIAAALAPYVPDEDATIVGHSLGGMVALELAAMRVRRLATRVFGIGIKVVWSEDELGRMARLADRVQAEFATREEAEARAATVAGLANAPSRVVERGVVRGVRNWELSFDQKAFAVGAPDMGKLMQVADCPVHLACGHLDNMVDITQLQCFDAAPTRLAGGHNVMVECPDAVLKWIVQHERS